MGLRDQVFQIGREMRLSSLLRLSRAKTSVPVLCFHRISEDQDLFFPPMRPELFRKLLKSMLRHYDCISLEEAASERRLPRRAFVVTFDDGYSDFIETALPILKELKIQSTHAILPGLIESEGTIWTQRLSSILTQRRMKDATSVSDWGELRKNLFSQLKVFSVNERNQALQKMEQDTGVKGEGPRLMNWQEIQRCAEAGVEIASHSLNHEPLTSYSFSELKQDLQLSKELIESKIKAEVKTIAFPNGFYNEVVLRVSEALGYRRALLCDDLFYTRKASSALKVIPRFVMGSSSLAEEVLRAEGLHTYLRQARSWVKPQ